MKASDLKYHHELNNPGSHYFRDNMKFLGDTMRNYGVKEHTDCYELFRRRSVKDGVTASAYFDKITFNVIFKTK